ncbi:MAG: ExeM/NucH family extracellular endonuclease [Rubrivivax sp.]
MRYHTLFRRSAVALALAASTSLAFAADTPIYTLQGSGASAPSQYLNTAVTTTGVVTKRNSNGFFIQDLTGDGNPATSDGIFVFSTQYTPTVGSLVRVAGTLVEFNTGAAGNTGTSTKPLTEISTVTAVTELGTGYTIAPTPITLPLAEGDSLERFEGMLVTINSPLTVQQNYFQPRYGQLTLGAGGRHETPTNRYRAGSPEAIAFADLQYRGRILLDDGSAAQNRNPTPYVGSNGAPRTGDTLATLTGVIDFGLATASTSGIALYKLHPTVEPVFAASNPRPAAPAAVGGNIRVGVANVLNFFTTFTNGQNASGQTGQVCTQDGSTPSASLCRGANNITEFNRQRAKIVLSLAGLNADAVGLMEIQNNGSVAAQNLVDALNAAVGAGTYAVVPDPAQGTGGDAIKVALIYKPAKLSRVGNAVSDTDAINNRPTLSQTFAAANGEKFTVMVNHLKSKSSCPSGSGGDADQGDGQGCWNATRVQQAQRLRSFVAQQQAASGSSDVLLIGDFNSYAQEDPMVDLTSNGYVDQIGRFHTLGYSYVFDGTSGRIDHAIASNTLSSKVTGALLWHINADESLQQDYNQEFKAPATTCSGLCPPDPYDGTLPARASDHDPVLLGLNLYKTFTGTAGRDGIVGSAGDDILIGGLGADTLTGGAGSNIFVYRTLLDAGDLIMDFVPGKDLLDLRTLMLMIGADPATAFAKGIVSLVSSRGSTLVQIDPDGSAGPTAARTLATLQNVNPASIVVTRDFVLQ